MIFIKCSNPRCEAEEGKFLWDEQSNVVEGGGIVKPWEPGAVSLLVRCPNCGTDTKVWLKGLKKEDRVPRGM
jgi:hypothetical protein